MSAVICEVDWDNCESARVSVDGTLFTLIPKKGQVVGI